MATSTKTAAKTARKTTARQAAAEPAPAAEATWERKGAARIETPKLAHIVAQRLRRRIANGELPPGSSLPREADLMAQFGVSRPALREALRVLEAESLISLGRGARAGATVMAPSMSQVAHYGTFYLVAHGTTLREIHEARSLIEPSIVMLLARQRPPALIGQLCESVQTGRDALATDLKSAMLATNRFHELLVEAAANRALSLLVGMLHDIAVVNYMALDEGSPDIAAMTRIVGKTLDMFDEMVGLLEAGKADEAAVFWRGYLTRATRILAGSGRADQALAL